MRTGVEEETAVALQSASQSTIEKLSPPPVEVKSKGSRCTRRDWGQSQEALPDDVEILPFRPERLPLCPHHSPETVPSNMTHDLLTSKTQGSTSVLSRLKARPTPSLKAPCEGTPGTLV